MSGGPILAFALPPLDGPTSGGTRFNRRLIDALGALGRPPEVWSLEQAERIVAELRPRTLWVDSLWLHAIPRLVRQAAPACRIGLLAHWLPTLVSHGERPPRDALSPEERAALDHAEGALVPSEYLASELTGLGVDPSRVRVLEPGSALPLEPTPPRRHDGPVRAVVVANLLPGKGIAPLLEGLARRLRSSDALELRVIGSRTMAPDYAERCRATVEEHPGLCDRVDLVGALSHRDCIENLRQADLLVSASRMESYGMALADARAAGRPILARRGGNVAAHVEARWGGGLVSDEDSLAAALVDVVRDREALARRQHLAWTHRMQRLWSAVASALLDHGEDWPPPRRS